MIKCYCCVGSMCFCEKIDAIFLGHASCISLTNFSRGLRKIDSLTQCCVVYYERIFFSFFNYLIEIIHPLQGSYFMGVNNSCYFKVFFTYTICFRVILLDYLLQRSITFTKLFEKKEISHVRQKPRTFSPLLYARGTHFLTHF